MREFLREKLRIWGAEAKLLWHWWYSFQSYAKSALWIVPIVAIPVERVLTYALLAVDGWLGWPFLDLGAEGARAMYGTVITLTLSFLVFTFGSLLVAIQVASGQMTPRVIATTLLRDNTVRYTVGLFVFALLLAVRALVRTEEKVNQSALFATAILGIACLMAFLYLIDYAARLLRPGSIVWRVGQSGLSVIDAVYPDPCSGPEPGEDLAPNLGSPDRIVLHEGRSAVVLAVNLNVMEIEARRSNCVVEFAPRVGDFVAVGEPLFRLYGDAATIDERRLRATVATGPERTMEQDPMFSFRILLDIALKALSKAINDPTTAVLAIDQLQRLLRALGKRALSAEMIFSADGRLRVIFRTPNWEDYVRLTFTELRLNGVDSMQIARRLRAVIENLLQSLPEHRHPELHRELDLLERSLPQIYALPEDIALAGVADSQGLGGSDRSHAR